MAVTSLPDHVRALLTPGLLAPGVQPDLVQTHGAYVVLAVDRVYKLKKPVNLGFLDYSTLDGRRAACEAELTLNRRLTTGVYLRVARVTRSATGYGLDGDGETVDYAVVMHRLPADRMMDRLVERDEVSAELIARLAKRLAGFYAAAATGGRIDAFGAPAALLANWQENFSQTLPYVGRTLTVETYRRIASSVYADLPRLRPLLNERMAAGRVRDCHGDLRLSAVCFDNTIQVYDCIEFNERFRYSDVAADISFLTMDLDAHDRPDLADEFLAHFIAATGDLTLPAVLPFYQCYRAYVRGKVDGFLLDAPEAPARQRRQARAAARRRFQLAAGYIRPRRPVLAAVAGEDAATRDAIAAALAGRLGAVLLHGVREGVVTAAGDRLRAGIPVVVSGEHSAASWPRLRALAVQTRAHFLVVDLGQERALPGAILLAGDQPLRAILAELHRRLGARYGVPATRRVAGLVATAGRIAHDSRDSKMRTDAGRTDTGRGGR